MYICSNNQKLNSMKTTAEKLNKLEFTQVQRQTLKKIIKTGFWGDTEIIFSDGLEYDAWAFTTNINSDASHSGIMSGIKKKLLKTNTNLICMCSDWWSDNSGDMIFFNTELLSPKQLVAYFTE
jgi:hypothetical protein